jgi:UDP-glucose:tetrahydrobiopterin glucosyltransferase
VRPDDVDALAKAVARVGKLDRATCRARAEARFSLDAMAQRMEAWFDDVV